jgi:hypothetical protein
MGEVGCVNDDITKSPLGKPSVIIGAVVAGIAIWLVLVAVMFSFVARSWFHLQDEIRAFEAYGPSPGGLASVDEPEPRLLQMYIFGRQDVDVLIYEFDASSSDDVLRSSDFLDTLISVYRGIDLDTVSHAVVLSPEGVAVAKEKGLDLEDGRASDYPERLSEYLEAGEVLAIVRLTSSGVDFDGTTESIEQRLAELDQVFEERYALFHD